MGESTPLLQNESEICICLGDPASTKTAQTPGCKKPTFHITYSASAREKQTSADRSRHMSSITNSPHSHTQREKEQIS